MNLDIFATAVLAVAVIAGVLLAAVLGFSLTRRDLRIWPPAHRGSWQFHLSFGLFRVYCGATALFALLDWGSLGWDHWARLAIGLPIMVVGAFVTVRGYVWLGWRNTYGEPDGLVTGGLYEYSRNPQYVASVLATIGLGLTANSFGTLLLAGGLFLLYLLFALNEEPWLREGYGEAYREYARKTPRFVDERTFARARERIETAL
jgi:protein-S-isoprenylcysteine O-methyltransferase Ste14